MAQRPFPNGYGALFVPPAATTLAENIKEAAAPEVRALADTLVDVARSASAFFVETVGINVTASRMAEVGIGMALFFKLRNYPMAAYATSSSRKV